MSEEPRVSILSSIFNVRPYIGQTIQSVLNQTYTNWEWVIVDDGSTDGTGDIIKDVKDNRIRYVSQERAISQHFAKNFNSALMMCSGSLVALIDGDDCWPHDKLRLQVSSFDDPSVVLSYGESYLVDHKGKKIGFIGIPKDLSSANNSPRGSALKILLFEKSCFMVNPTVMLRRDALLRIGGFLEIEGMGQDFPTWVRLALEGKFAAIPACLGYYRKHVSSMSSMQNQEITFNHEIVFLEKFVIAYNAELKSLGLYYDMKELKEHWEEIKKYIPYNKALYMMMFGLFKEARSEFKNFLKNTPTVKNKLIYSLIILSSLLRTDLVNPVIFLQEKTKSINQCISLAI